MVVAKEITGQLTRVGLNGIEIALVRYRYVMLFYYGVLWLPNQFLVPVHSSVAATKLAQTEMKTGRRMPWKNPMYFVHEHIHNVIRCQSQD